MKKTLSLIIIAILILLSPIIYLALSWTVIMGGTWLFAPTPNDPQITYGEFPFELVYEIDGETVTVSDVYVCEYMGIERSASGDKNRSWRGYVKSTGYRGVFLMEDDERKVFCNIGYPEYYMSDYPEYYIKGNKYSPITPSIYCQEKRARAKLSETELMSKYNIKIISWSISPAIDNSFG